VGLVGCGRWGALILRDLRLLGCRVTAVARSVESRRRAEAGGADVVLSVAALPQVDGVVVATTTFTHAEVIESLLDRRVPIFVEKPLCDVAADADRIAARAADRVFVMDKWRYQPGIRELARIAASHELGPVVGLRTFRLGWGNPHETSDSVWVLAPHDLSIALEVLGQVPSARSAVAEWAGGDLVGLVGICGDAPWHVLEISSRRRTNRRAVQLLCRDGIAELDDSHSTHVCVTRTPGGRGMAAPEIELREVPGEMPLLAELRVFVEHLAGGPPPRSAAAEGAAVVRVLTDLRQLAGVPDSTRSPTEGTATF
jgi:predicted dehydrogenase